MPAYRARRLVPAVALALLGFAAAATADVVTGTAPGEPSSPACTLVPEIVCGGPE